MYIYIYAHKHVFYPLSKGQPLFVVWTNQKANQFLEISQVYTPTMPQTSHILTFLARTMSIARSYVILPAASRDEDCIWIRMQERAALWFSAAAIKTRQHIQNLSSCASDNSIIISMLREFSGKCSVLSHAAFQEENMHSCRDLDGHTTGIVQHVQYLYNQVQSKEPSTQISLRQTNRTLQYQFQLEWRLFMTLQFHSM